MALPENLVAEFDELVTHYPEGHEGRRSGLIPALHRCQEELGGWISPDTMRDCAEYFDLEPVEVATDVEDAHGHDRDVVDLVQRLQRQAHALHHRARDDLELFLWARLGQVGMHAPAVDGGDGGIDGDQINSRFPQYKEQKGEMGMLAPEAIADAFWTLHTQHPSAWTLELDLRPYKESF